MIVSAVAGDVAAWLAIAGSIGAGVAIIRSVQVRSTLDVLKEANDELRKIVDDERKARERDQAECNTQLAELRGRTDLMTSDFGRQIAKAIADEWRAMRRKEGES